MQQSLLNQKLWVSRDWLASDLNFIYATWARSLHFDAHYRASYGEMSGDDQWYAAVRERIDIILDRPETMVSVACLVDAPEVILGYSVFAKRKLWWVYVKKAWREMGIASTLVPETINECGFVTKIGKRIKPRSWPVNPFFPEEQTRGEV